jgi:diguanylate cyclase (GGDEF)-like protein
MRKNDTPVCYYTGKIVLFRRAHLPIGKPCALGRTPVNAMTTAHPLSFDGYEELIRKPLEHSDQRSFTCIGRLLESAPDLQGSCPFSFLIKAIASVAISPREGRNHWKKILEHKRRLESQVHRTVNIRTACVDFYDQLGVDPSAPSEPPAASNVPKPATPSIQPAAGLLPVQNGLYLERLKEELMRARRYKHALSIIMFDVDLRTAAAQAAEKVVAVIVKMVNKAVRTVDILARHSDNLFLLLLPNTNKREALELAGRLKDNICQRTTRIPGLSEGIPITIAVGQCTKDDTASDFIKRLEHLIQAGKHASHSEILTLE